VIHGNNLMRKNVAAFEALLLSVTVAMLAVTMPLNGVNGSIKLVVDHTWYVSPETLDQLKRSLPGMLAMGTQLGFTRAMPAPPVAELAMPASFTEVTVA
jgi:hypothetical protein